MEQLDLTTPVTTPNITLYRVRRLILEWGATVAEASINILVVGANGETRDFTYSGQTARTLLNQLNTMNLSSNSLQKRILQRLIADQHLAGTISGSPD